MDVDDPVFESQTEEASTEEVVTEGSRGATGTASQKVKLPYFHRTLTPQDSQLIGDITPKRIDEAQALAPVVDASSGLVQGSAWNAAKIWEERDYTPWAKDTLQSLFSSDMVAFKFNDVEVIISEISDIKGHANVTYSRGKPRYMFSFSFVLNVDVEVPRGDDNFSGKVTVDDVMNDVLEDIELSMEWTARPSNAHLKDCNTATTGKPMKSFILSKMQLFESEYQKKQ